MDHFVSVISNHVAMMMDLTKMPLKVLITPFLFMDHFVSVISNHVCQDSSHAVRCIPGLRHITSCTTASI